MNTLESNSQHLPIDVSAFKRSFLDIVEIEVDQEVDEVLKFRLFTLRVEVCVNWA